MRLGLATLGAVTAAIAAVTVTAPVERFAATPSAVAAGKVWLLFTSALVAAHPVALSIAGFAAVGAASLLLVGPRVTLAAAILGHVGSALAVYGVLALLRDAEAGDQLDYGTSDAIAAWLGAIAVVVWTRRSPRAAVGLCLVAAAVGWLCDGDLTILDWEHAVSLCIGVSLAVPLHTPTMGAWPGRSR